MLFYSPCRRLWSAVLLLNVSLAYAQSDSVGRGEAAPALDYESPFARYQKFDDQTVAPWRETNDTVRTIGGWRTYAKEAAQPGPAATKAAANPTSGASSTSPAAPPWPSAKPGPAADREQSPSTSGSHQGHGGKP